jgi:membrane protein required for colicin V production
LSKVDLTLALIILVGAYSGFRDGFRVEFISTLALLLGLLLGFKFMGITMVALEEEFFIDEYALPYIAFGAVFAGVILLVNLLAKLVFDRYPDPLLGLLDPYAGGFIGFLRTSFMISIVLWLLDSLQIHFPSEWTTDSWLWQMVAHFAPDTLKAIGNLVPFFADLI